MKKFLFVLLVTLMAFSGFARDFSYEFAGQTLTYTVIDETQKTCRTKNGDQSTLMPGNIAEGDLIIPSQAIDGDKKYTVISIGDYSFGGCHALTSVTILNSVKSIGYGAFQSCTEMTSVTIPDSVTDIDDRAFSACVSLPSVTIPNSVTHIGNGAFAECWSLNSSLSIPDSVTSLGEYAFSYCSGLTSVYYQTNEPIASYENTFSDYTKPTLYVPAEAVEKCRTIAPWKNFSKIVAYDFSGEATGIDEVSAEVNSEVPYEVYSLNGVRLGNSTDNLAPGIYIICQGERINKIAVK